MTPLRDHPDEAPPTPSLAPTVLVAAAIASWGAVWHLVRSGSADLAVVACVGGLLTAAAAVQRRHGFVLALVAAGCGVATVAAAGGGGADRSTAAAVAVGAYVLARPARAEPTGPSITSAIAVGVAQAGMARAGPGTWVVWWLLVAVCTLELRLRSGGTALAIDRRIGGAVRAVADRLATAVLFVGSCLVLYLPGTLVRMVGAARRPPSSTWVLSSSARSSHRQAQLPFIAQPARARRTALVAALTLVVVSSVLVVGRSDGGPAATGGSAPSSSPFAAQGPPLSELEAYRGTPWADQLELEQREYGRSGLESSPIGGFITGDVDGEHTDVVDGERRTLQPSCDCPTYDVWLFGGSAVFGMGQRDEHTIASSLVRQAQDRGVGLRVRNLGVPGWTLWQEQIRFAHLLSTEPPPDLVVFIDGFNDVVGTVVGGTLRGLADDRPSSLVTDEVEQFVSAGASPLEVADGEQFGELAARRYLRVMGTIDTLAAADDVPTLFFFQPDALADPGQRAAARRTFPEDLPDIDVVLDAALRTAARSLHPEVVDLRDLFDGSPPVFADLVHTNEAGAREVAAAVLDDVIGTLRPSG